MGISRLSEFWPDWQITEELGQGAYGTVYKAINRAGGFDAYCAIKVISIPASKAEYDALRSEGMTEFDVNRYFKEIAEDFVNEIKVMHTLKDAPHVVGVEAFKILEKESGVGWDIYIRMPLLNSFKDYLDNNTPNEGEVLKLGIEIATALEICHKENIIHRDIKPANIFTTKYGEFKLGDFGIAKELEKTTGAISSKGTYSFMAPEVARGERYDATVDIYSLGIVLYTLLNNNRQPFVDPNSSHITYNDRKEAIDRRLSGEPMPPPVNASKELASIILTACSHDPKRRFESATAFKNALLSYKNGYNTPKPETVSDKTVAINKNENIDLTLTAKAKVNQQQNIEPKKVPQASTNQKKKGSKAGLVIALIVVLLLMAGGAAYYIASSKDDKQTNAKTEEMATKKITQASVDEEENETVPVVDEPTYEITDRNISDDGLKWYLSDDGTLTISGEGKMADYEYDYETSKSTSPWDENTDNIKKVVIEEGITSIGNCAFHNCSYLASVTIPDSVTSIGVEAFSGCTSLKTILIPDSVTTIGQIAFGNCSSLDHIVLSNSITSIENDTFSHCTALNKIIIPNSVADIGDSSFYGCTELTEISFSKNLNAIGMGAFFGCSKLENVVIPNSVVFINEAAFSGCVSLQSIIIPKSVTYIGGYVFDNCPDVVINCSSSSAAEKYAMENDILYLMDSVEYEIIPIDRPYKNNNDQVLIDNHYDLVEINGVSYSISSINESLNQKMEEFLFTEYELEEAAEGPWLSPEYPYENIGSSIVTYNKNGILSIKLETQWYMGGVSNRCQYGHTYNINTGMEPTLIELIGQNEQQLTNLLKDIVWEYLNVNIYGSADYYDKDIEYNLLTAYNLEDFEYYIEENGEIILCLNYDFTSTADGPVQVPTGMHVYMN